MVSCTSWTHPTPRTTCSSRAGSAARSRRTGSPERCRTWSRGTSACAPGSPAWRRPAPGRRAARAGGADSSPCWRRGRRRTPARDLFVQQIEAPFDLERGPLLRATLVRLGDGEHLLCLVLHHIVADGWSLGLMCEEIAALYRGDAEVPPLPIQYADYALWQRRESGAERPDYWLGGSPACRRWTCTAAASVRRSAPRAGPRCGNGCRSCSVRRGGAVRAEPAGDAVHDRAGRLPGGAGAAQRPGRRLRRHAHLRTGRGRAGAADRPVRQHARAARRPVRRPDLP